jgi:cell shape-determining protein MreC
MSRLDAFLELKLENERLREELKELQQDLEDEDIRKFPLYSYEHPLTSSHSTTTGTSTNISTILPESILTNTLIGFFFKFVSRNQE